MDPLEELRQHIERNVDHEARIPEDSRESLSPSGRYRMSFECYRMKAVDTNWNVARVQVSDAATSEVLQSYMRNDDLCYHAGVAKGEHEFLLLAEDFEGQSIYSPTLRRFESVGQTNDGFIWVSFHPSPSGRYLAVEGCYWACPFMVVIYDFTEPMTLPLPKILDCNSVDFDGWLSDSTFQVKSSFGDRQIHTLP